MTRAHRRVQRLRRADRQGRSSATSTAAMDRDAERRAANRRSAGSSPTRSSRLAGGSANASRFMNPGGIRANLDAGDVTHGEAFAVQPFSNIVTTMDLTGAQIETMLEQQFTVSATGSRPAARRRPSCCRRPASRTRGTPAGPAGDRVDPATIEAERRAARSRRQTYRVVVNNFLATGGDDFPILN